MPMRPGLSGEADENTRLLNGDEEQDDSHSYRAAEEGAFQLHGKDSSNGSSSNSKYDKHQNDTHHVRIPGGQKRNRSGLWKIAANQADRAQHRKEISEKLREIDGSVFTDYHKSDDFLKTIKNKKLKQFYVDQNARISAWYEVDAGA